MRSNIDVVIAEQYAHTFFAGPTSRADRASCQERRGHWHCSVVEVKQFQIEIKAIWSPSGLVHRIGAITTAQALKSVSAAVAIAVATAIRAIARPRILRASLQKEHFLTSDHRRDSAGRRNARNWNRHGIRDRRAGRFLTNGQACGHYQCRDRCEKSLSHRMLLARPPRVVSRPGSI